MRLDRAEALRYLGVKGAPDAELAERVESVAAELEGQLAPRSALRVFELTRTDRGYDLGGLRLTGKLAARLLDGCGKCAVLVCTLGLEFDRLLARTQARDMARAVILDACGSALVEAGCAAAEEELRALAPGHYLTDRFSPGYGDLPLALQSGLCDAVDAKRRLGVYVTESLMLNPAKSVSALIGISPTPQPARVRGCAFCSMHKTCTFRKEGGRCEI